jgi:hypothetical protein
MNEIIAAILLVVGGGCIGGVVAWYVMEKRCEVLRLRYNFILESFITFIRFSREFHKETNDNNG